MKWLYTHYVCSRLDGTPKDDYEMWLSLLDSELTPDLREVYLKAKEFTAIYAVLLSFHTGRGPPR